MSVTLICGCAGSGKTTHCKKIEDDYNIKIYHDDWVATQYHANKIVKRHMMNIFPQAKCASEISKSNIIKWLKEEPKLNTLLKNYWMVAFSNMISAALISFGGTDSNVLVECPFLDDNIKALKEIHGDELIIKWVSHEPDILYSRLEARGWDDDRITKTLLTQVGQSIKYGGILDEIIKG